MDVFHTRHEDPSLIAMIHMTSRRIRQELAKTVLPERLLARLAILCFAVLALFHPSALANDASNWRKLTAEVSEAVSRSDYTNAADKVVQALAISEKFGQGDRRYADNLAAWAYINMQLQ